MTSEIVIPNTEVYQSEPFEEIEPRVVELLKTAFDASQLYEVDEDNSVEFKLLDDCIFSYDGLEHLYTNKEGEFMVYFSHENSVTVGGKSCLLHFTKFG